VVINCTTCAHCNKQNSRNWYAWTCSLFPRHEINPANGEDEPSCWPVRDVLQVTRLSRDPKSACLRHEVLPEVGEAVVKEARGEKSVSFKSKEPAK